MTVNMMRPIRRVVRAEEPEWLVWALVAVMLAIGLGVGAIVQSRTETFAQGTLSLRYPAGWIRMAGEDPSELINVSQPFETTLFPANIRLRQMPASEVSRMAQTLGDLALAWSNRQAAALLGYKVLGMEPITVRGQEAVLVDYVYVAEPPMAGPNSVPLVARGVDVVLRQGDALTVVSFEADADAYAGQETTWRRILSSLDLE